MIGVRNSCVVLAVVLVVSVGVAGRASSQQIRRNINSLNAAQLAALRHGVEVMKLRQATDPTSWAFQANIHGTPGPETDPLFKDCQHGTLHFLTWHRGYLYYFERILREASGDLTLTLPYWDWSTNRSVPLAYRQPAGPGNSLFHPRILNNGALLPITTVVFDRDTALGRPTFGSFSSLLEGSPHGAVHVMVGGDMGSVPTSARDGIFWLHHANIDRLWNLWLNQSIHANPTDASFLDRTFNYVDENGTRITRRVRDIINSADLGYRYDNVSNPPATTSPSVPELAAVPAPGGHGHEIGSATPSHSVEVASGNEEHGIADAPGVATTESVLVASSRLPSETEATPPRTESERLDFAVKKIPLTFAEAGAEAISGAAERVSAESPERIQLMIYGLRMAAPPPYTYGVYLNMPENANEERRREYYVGSLNLFGLSDIDREAPGEHEGHGDLQQVLDATDTVVRLRSAGAWNPDRLELTFLPIAPTPVEGEQESLEAAYEQAARETQVRFDRVELRISREPAASADSLPEHAAPTGSLPASQRVALPLPPSKRAVLELATEPELGAGSAGDSPADRVEMIRRLWDERRRLAHELDVIDAEIARQTKESICGNGVDFQDVERYDGLAGVDKEFVKTFEPAVGQLQWVNDLVDRFSNPGETPGEVNGVRWGSGALIGPDLFLSAGHCFDSDAGGWEMPQRNGVTILPHEIATLMRVNFGYQVDPTTGNPRRSKSFPVSQLVEYREGGLDYAIVRLAPNADGELPGQLYTPLKVSISDLTTPGTILCLIQHPNGMPKKIHAGPLKANTGARITYATLDTLGGSSGAAVLGPSGEIVGVHTNGGCDTALGYNFGVPIGAIRVQSPTIP
jgi:hypothetical protein